MNPIPAQPAARVGGGFSLRLAAALLTSAAAASPSLAQTPAPPSGNLPRASALANELLGKRPAAASTPAAGTPAQTAPAPAPAASRPTPVGNPFNASNSNSGMGSSPPRPGGAAGSTTARPPSDGSGSSGGSSAAASPASTAAPAPGRPTGTPTVPDTVGSRVPRAMAQAALELHNQARREVGTPALMWSVELAEFAQKWANHLATEKGCRMEHRPHAGAWGTQYGENLFWGSASSFNARDASKSWYDEIRDFRPGVLTNSNWHKTGHYTQMVWRSTTLVGMGQAVCASGAILIVANYDPPGNYMGQAPY